MKRTYAQTITVILFAGLIAGAIVLSRSGSPGHAKGGQQRYGFALQDVARASGVNFVHQAPKLDPRLDHILPQIASMGASDSVVDGNGVGCSDLHATNSQFGSQH